MTDSDLENPLPQPIFSRPTIIHEFIAFRDVLFVRGAIYRLDGEAAPAISLRMADGSLVPMLRRDDPVWVQDDTRWDFNFRMLLDQGSFEAYTKISLVFDYPAGRYELTDPWSTGTITDPVRTLADLFWDEVKSRSGVTVLEVGSRARSGITRRSMFPDDCSYTGLDLLAGDNVDVVADAHAMSNVLPHNYFDFAFSVSVWEHLAMPWKVSLELNRVLKLDGLAFLQTHQSWPLHEAPWDYFRFSKSAWTTLFNKATGFEVVRAEHGLPVVMAQSLPFVESVHDVGWHYGYLSSMAIVRKIGETSLSWPVETTTASEGIYPY